MTNYQINELGHLWKKYNEYSEKLADAIGRTNNLVGEYAEYLAKQYIDGDLLETSNKSADIKGKDGKLYQVKSRKIDGTRLCTKLGVIRSWEFDFLFVILFDKNGVVKKALISPKTVTKEFAGEKNTHENGWVITTTDEFLNHVENEDITECLT